MYRVSTSCIRLDSYTMIYRQWIPYNKKPTILVINNSSPFSLQFIQNNSFIPLSIHLQIEGIDRFCRLQKLASDPEYEPDVVFASVDVDEANVRFTLSLYVLIYTTGKL